MIPKKIHYIWLGKNKKPNLACICINSWFEKMPEYEIIEWNESNIDIKKIENENKFFKECKKRKLWSFMADYLRLYILYEHGGIYLDTDVQVIKSFEPLLKNKFFIGYEYVPILGEDAIIEGTGIIAAEKHNPIVKKLLEFYENEIWKVDYYTIPNVVKNVLKDCQDEYKIYPTQYFAPYNYDVEFNKTCITENTFCIHWFDGSWKDNLNVRLFLRCKHIDNRLVKKLAQFKQLCGFYYHKLIK